MTPLKNPAVSVALGANELPCADCGQVVAAPDAGTVVKIERVIKSRVDYVLMSKCPACAARDTEAADLVHDHLPGGLVVGDQRFGSDGAVRLLIEARVAQDAAGVLPTPSKETRSSAAVLASEIFHLGKAARGLRWRGRLSPPASVVADAVRLVRPGTANPYPWAHIDQEERARLFEGTGRVLAERIALLSPPVALAPPALASGEVRGAIPAGAGCLYCGVGSVTLSALAVVRRGGTEHAARSIWTRRHVNATRIGAHRSSPSNLVGWLCKACERAASDAGSANSASAMEDALSTFLGVSRRSLAGDDLWVTGLKGWGALVADALSCGNPAPVSNPEPWDHLSQAKRENLAREWRRGGSET